MTSVAELPPPQLESRQAAAARLAYAMQRPGGLAILCGPSGTGVSTVLALLAQSLAATPRSCGVRRIVNWVDAVAGEPLPDVVLADDAHACEVAMLRRLVDRCRQRTPAASVVLAGQGRLLSLLARDADLERSVMLRAVVHPCSYAETRRLLEAALFEPHAARIDAAAHAGIARTIHEIAAGIPAAVVRLAELAGVVAAGRPDGSLSAGDVEAIHRRLCLRAA